MKRTKRTGHKTATACAAAIGLMVMALPPPARAQQPPQRGCLAVAKSEYDSAKQKNLLRSRFGNYVRTGRPFRRAYWYCA
ncbi:MAG TPA: hypothetical protein VGC38_02570 [Pseudolabrys sp.]